MESKPPAKRVRFNGDNEPLTQEKQEADVTGTGAKGCAEDVLDPITAEVLGQSEDLAASYRNAKPYPHGMIRNFCKDGFLGERSFVFS